MNIIKSLLINADYIKQLIGIEYALNCYLTDEVYSIYSCVKEVQILRDLLYENIVQSVT